MVNTFGDDKFLLWYKGNDEGIYESALESDSWNSWLVTIYNSRAFVEIQRHGLQRL